jgi:antitoxin component YwqK of YwqJK toxin-antitoxin module
MENILIKMANIIGHWEDDKMNGDVKIYDKNNNLKLEGEFENGRLKIDIRYDRDSISLIHSK